MTPHKNRSGCLFFVLSAMAVLLAISFGITHNATADWCADFFMASAIILILCGRLWSGKDVIAETRHVLEGARSRSFPVAWWLSTAGYLGITWLVVFAMRPFAAAIMRACGVQSFALGIPSILALAFDAPSARLRAEGSAAMFFVSAVLGLMTVLKCESKVQDSSSRTSEQSDGTPP